MRAADGAFGDGRYAEARRLFQAAFDLNASPAAAEGLRRVDSAEAVLCPSGGACGTLFIRVTAAAEILVDGRSLGVAASIVLRVSAGRHLVRLETAEWRFPQALQVATGETSEIEVDLERDGSPGKRVGSSHAAGARRSSPGSPVRPTRSRSTVESSSWACSER